MAALKSNRLLPVIAGIAVLAGVAVIIFGGDSPSSTRTMKHPPTAGAPASADTPADTIRTLTARVADASQRMDRLAQQNQALQQQNHRLMAHNQNLTDQQHSITATVTHQVTQRLEKAQHAKRSILARLTQRVDTLGNQIQGLAPGKNNKSIGDADAYPVQRTRPRYVWIAALAGAADTHAAHPANSLLHGLGTTPARPPSKSTAPHNTPHKKTAKADTNHSNRPRPVATVPANATLIGSTAMTALLGIVPKNANVRDPAHFKVLTGAQNLASQGFTIPDLVGAVWSGTAIGDWTLSCVRARVDSVTFVFADGTIRTMSDDQYNHGRASKQRLRANHELGFLSDAHGIPCIGGTRHSDFPQFLVNVAGASALSGAGAALAGGETTQSVSGLTGAVTSTVTGKPGRYILGQTAASAANQVVQYLLKRQKDHFDSVLVRAGHRVAIHVERELHIDYTPHGRKLSYGNPLTSTTKQTPLD